MATATCITPQWSGTTTPQVKLTVTEAASSSTSNNYATINWQLDYVTHGYVVDDGPRWHDYSVIIDGVEQKNDSCYIDDKASFTIASGTCYPTRTTTARAVNFQFTFYWNNVFWSGVDSGVSHTPTGSISIAAYNPPAPTVYTMYIYYNQLGGQISSSSNYKVDNNNWGWIVPKDRQDTSTFLQTVSTGGSVNILSSTDLGLYKTGYSASQWKPINGSGEDIGSTTRYNSGTYAASDLNSNISSQDCYLYLAPAWSANTYTVNFDPNGGSVSLTSIRVTYDSTYGSLPIPTRTGYAFDGWYTSNGTRVYSNTKVNITSTQTLYAQWTANAFNLTLYYNNDSNQTESTNIAYGTTKTITPPTRSGYIFAGWATSSVGELNRSFTKAISLTSSQNSGISIYNNNSNGAVEHSYSSNSKLGDRYGYGVLTIKKVKGKQANPDFGGFYRPAYLSLNTTYVHSFWASLPVGYHFNYYSNIEGNSGVTFTWLTDNKGSGYPQIYAYKIDSTNANSSQLNKTFGHIAVKPNDTNQKDEVTWYLGANQITENPNEAQIFTPGVGNSELHAMWIKEPYTVTLNKNQSQGSEPESFKVNYWETSFSCPGQKNLSAPETSHIYNFEGWSTSADGTGLYAPNSSVPISKDMTLYAIWSTPVNYHWLYGSNNAEANRHTHTTKIYYTGKYNYQPKLTIVGSDIALKVYNADSGNLFGVSKIDAYQLQGWYSEPHGRGSYLSDRAFYNCKITDVYASAKIIGGIPIYDESAKEWVQTFPYIYNEDKGWTPVQGYICNDVNANLKWVRMGGYI